MKKILFLLLLSVSMYGQVPADATPLENIQITNNAQDNVSTKVAVQTNDGVINWKYIADIDVKTKARLSTGLLKNGLISANGDPTKFNITAGIGIISNFDDPENPTSTIVNFPAFTGITPTYLLTGTITYVAINSTPAVVMQATPFTPEQRRSLIVLGAVIHSNLTTINVLNNISAPTNAGTNQLHDFIEAVGALNLTGNKYTANGSNLQLNKSAGLIFKLGSNFANDWKNPHELAQTAGTSLTFRYRTQNGTEGSDRINLDPALYDNNNVLTAVPNNKFTIQTVTMFQSGLTRIQYGQNVYDDLATAKNAVFTRNFVLEPNSKENGIIRAYIIMRNTTTSLQNVADADILEAQKFGGVASGGVALTLANIVSALGYTPENVANKQNSLTADGTNTKYPTVTAVNSGLALKANLGSPTFTGTVAFEPSLRITGGNIQLNTGGTGLIDNVGGATFTMGFPTVGWNSNAPITATSFVNSSAPATNALLANGTTLANPISGTGTTTFLPKFTSSGVIGNSSVQEIAGSLRLLTGVNSADVSYGIGKEFSAGNASFFGWRYNSGTPYGFLTTFGNTAPFSLMPDGGRVLIGTPIDNGVDILQVNGSTSISSLAGTGTRTVVASSTGQLSATNTLSDLTLTGTPTAPTPTLGDNDTSIATTAFVYSNTVTLTGNQSISGNKTFVNDVSINGVKVGKGGGNISSNTVLGDSAGAGNTTGSNNLFLGQNAGLYNGGGFANTSSANSIFIGNNTGNGIGEVNQIVIGDSVQGKGDNTTTIGNPSTTATYLRGIVETNGGFKKTGGTSSQFLKADGSIDESDIVKNIVKDATQGSNITGTVSETILYSKLIPANTFKDGDFMTLFSRVAKSTVLGGLTQKVKINTSNTLTGATQIAQNFMVAANTLGHISRTFNITNGFIIGIKNDNPFVSDIVNSGIGSTFSIFDPTVDNYIFITGQLSNSADTMYHLGTKITN